jgi:beta-1,4-mannosyltransferase
MWVITIFIIILSYAVLRYDRWSVYVIVLGDLGRSPRMQYHAVCFAEQGYRVHLIGYPGSILMDDVLACPLIHVHYIPVLPTVLGVKLFNACVKLIVNAVYLSLQCGILLPRCSRILVQNPPSIPTLFIMQIICRIRCIPLMIDWHNLAFTLVDLQYKNRYLTNLSKL